ncbi:MAG: AlkA N-terminal domain-containing protein [bacterium]
MILPHDDVCYRAVRGRDARFDGWFVTAVTTTGIYCRPSCPAITPRRHNVRFYASAAGAQRGGFRACKRCRPDASPGSPEWDVRADLAGRALRLIADGVVDRDGVPGLARRLGYSERQLNRTLIAEVGAGPLALARANRAQTARVLLETTGMSVTDVAFAAGFASVRQFNDTVREIFAESPSALRARAGRRRQPRAGTVDLRLPYRPPMDVTATLRWLGWHAVPGVEVFRETAEGVSFVRTLDLPCAPGRVTLSPGGEGWVRALVELRDQRDLTAAVARVRRLLDLDADPDSVRDTLGASRDLADLVAARPGLRSPGAVDGPELAVRTVVGQQVSLAGARAVLGRIVATHGQPVFDDGAPDRLFPPPLVLAGVDPAGLPMPRARARSVVALSAALAGGELVLDPGVDRVETRRALLDLLGIGPWTADYISLRGLGDPDILLAGDLAVRRVAQQRGIQLSDGRADWAPWRSYATQHLWAVVLADRTTPNSPAVTHAAATKET